MYICIYNCCSNMNVEERIKTERKIPLKSRTIIHFMLVDNRIKEAISFALKPFDVSPQQFNVLRILRGQKEKASNLSTLNDRMVTKMSNTTRLVDKLLQKGYAHRVVCRTNRRKIEITITQEGKKVLTKMDKAIAKAEDNILRNFSEKELKQLNNLFDKF